MRAFRLVLHLLPVSLLAASPSDYLNAGKALQKSGRMAAARDSYQSAISHAQSGGDQTVPALALSGLAQVDLALGNYAAAVHEGEDARERFVRLGNQAEEAQIVTTLGIARYYTGEFEGALRDFERALAIAVKTGDRDAEVTRLNNIGNVDYALGRYGEALRQYQLAQQRLSSAGAEPWFASRRQLTIANLAVLFQRVGQYGRALELYTSAGTEREALPAPERAQMLSNIGTLYRRLGDPVKALETYREAQQLFHLQTQLAGQVSVLNNIGIVQSLDLGRQEEALRTFSEALALARKSGGKQGIMSCLLYRGEASLRLHRWPEAQSDFDAALSLAGELKAPEETWRAQYGRARVAEAEGAIEASDAALHEAVRVIESLRSGASGASGRSGFLIERRDVYDLLIGHRLQAGTLRPEEIFNLMERSRARDLQDRLRSVPLRLPELQKRLPDDTLLLEYWQGEHAIGLLRVRRDRVDFSYRELAEADLQALRALPGKLSDSGSQDWKETAAAASRLLLPGGLNEARRLVIVPDGELARIPFEALPQGGKLLLETESISYLPFASGFRGGPEPRAFSPPWHKMLVAFADPRPGAGAGSLAMSAEETQRLPDAGREVEEIAAALGGTSELHRNADARKEYLNAGPHAGAPFLHLATHAFADPADPERSYVLFSPAPGAAGFDYLFLKEAASLNGKGLAMVTVSACDSGAGQSVRGEGVQSFSAAFLAAGARATVTSLWRVGDRPSAELMQRFYRNLSQGATLSDALRNAKLAFLRSGTSAAHPTYWAAFVLHGEREIRAPRTISWMWLIAIPLLLLSSLGLLVALKKREETE